MIKKTEAIWSGIPLDSPLWHISPGVVCRATFWAVWRVKEAYCCWGQWLWFWWEDKDVVVVDDDELRKRGLVEKQRGVWNWRLRRVREWPCGGERHGNGRETLLLVWIGIWRVCFWVGFTISIILFYTRFFSVTKCLTSVDDGNNLEDLCFCKNV